MQIPYDTLPAARRSARRLDVLLDLLERRELSPTQLRVLLAASGDAKTLTELCSAVEHPRRSVRPVAWGLYLAGLLSQRHDPDTGEPAFAITMRGMSVLKPLMTAAGEVREQ